MKSLGVQTLMRLWLSDAFVVACDALKRVRPPRRLGLRRNLAA